MKNVKILIIPLLSLSGLGLVTELIMQPAGKTKPTHQETSFQANLCSSSDSSKNKIIDNILQTAFEKGRFNGCVLYAENGKILYNKAFGYANLQNKQSLSSESVFQIASTSKPFTAVAIMQLKEKNKINLDHLVNFYLPDFPYQGVTIRHLLQHRSGLPNYLYIADSYWDKRKPLTNDDMSKFLGRFAPRLSFVPGTVFKYCNTNYAYLAKIVETQSGMKFADYLKENIFNPLGMKNSYVYDAQTNNKQEAVTGYCFARKRGLYPRPNDYLDGIVGDKGVYSTVEDLFLFDQALYGDQLLSQESIQEAFTPATPFDEKHKKDYGLGFRVKENDKGQTIVYHHGWWKGFRTYYIHDKENKKTLLWFNNRSDVTISPYLDQIMYNIPGEESEEVLQGDYGSAE